MNCEALSSGLATFLRVSVSREPIWTIELSEVAAAGDLPHQAKLTILWPPALLGSLTISAVLTFGAIALPALTEVDRHHQPHRSRQTRAT